MQKKIRQAVSIILRYQSKIFVIKRQNHLKAFPGYTAFPGGKVDKADKRDSFYETLKVSAIREIKEELQLDITEYFPSKFYAKATTPDFNPLRYETYFFLVELDYLPRLIIDKNEINKSWWIKADDIITDFALGNHIMVYPVKRVLESLGDKSTICIEELFEFDNRSEAIPYIEPLKNFYQFMPLSNTVPPAERTNCFVIGDYEKILIDPSPKNQREYNLFLSEVNNFNITKIIISHHHKDHHQFSTHLARDLNLPIYISSDSEERIRRIYGEKYFDGIVIHNLAEGDILGLWLGQSIKAYEIPGHDEGHIGFAPENLNWFIVGDLFQGIGTVVVGGDEGDMSKYMASLKKVIALNPNCVVPSHGIALGGSNILQKTYDHRLIREAQVLDLYNSGQSVDDILKTIYFDLPLKLIPYAKANIHSHLKKLNIEKKLTKNYKLNKA
jgi:glyoxylase-like metal-dependent hydrolase (beta-lactamase superfamily II)/8-oxo-dGTP pyrophosphatase MutT (NUDIX family)